MISVNMNMLYNVRKRLPEDKDFMKFIRQEVLDFLKRYGYLPEKVCVRKDDYSHLLEVVNSTGGDSSVTVNGKRIPIVPQGSIQKNNIYLFPFVKQRRPHIYVGERRPL